MTGSMLLSTVILYSMGSLPIPASNSSGNRLISGVFSMFTACTSLLSFTKLSLIVSFRPSSVFWPSLSTTWKSSL